MDTARLFRLLAAGDISVWPDLSRDLERRADAENAAEALRLLHGQGCDIAAAQWLARITDAPDLQGLRAGVLALSHGWPLGKFRALAQDLLSGAYRLIPAGSFLMGSPENEEGRIIGEAQHPVEITQPFLLKTTPVTQGEWMALMGYNPSQAQNRLKVSKQRPVESVPWEDVVRFCDTHSVQTGGVYRLPTEAEWEYACRAGTTGARYGDLDAVAWYRDNVKRRTHSVGQKQPNAWGLYDMLGNVWEWCQDWYQYRYPSEPQRDPKGPPSGDYRVNRGGSRDSAAYDCRAAQRNYKAPAHRYNHIGFRPVGLLASY